MAVNVCLDAGHYGKYNRSPAVSSYYESDMTWKLHNYLKKELESFGIVVVTTRTNQNTDRALYERGAASKGCNLFISVHSNAVGNGVNENVDYPVAYVLLNGSSTDIGLKLAKVVEAVMGTAEGQQHGIWRQKSRFIRLCSIPQQRDGEIRRYGGSPAVRFRQRHRFARAAGPEQEDCKQGSCQ